jgi:hypothetical protein
MHPKSPLQIRAREKNACLSGQFSFDIRGVAGLETRYPEMKECPAASRRGDVRKSRNQVYMKLTAVVLSLLLLPISIKLSAETANVAPRGTAFANAELWPPGNWNISKLIDRDRSSSFHLDAVPPAGSAYTVDLGTNYAISQLKLWPRQDGCCGDRFSNLRVSLHTALANGELGPEVWGTNLFTDGSNPGATAGTVVTVEPLTVQTGRWVQIKSLASPVGAYALQMTELEVFADIPPGEVNRAAGTQATSNRPLYAGRSAALLVDGAYSSSDIVHGEEVIEPGFAYTIDLGVEVDMNRIVIIPRRDGCCAERLTNYRVSVHGESGGSIGNAVWSADLRTDGSNPGSEPDSQEVIEASLDADGVFKGRYVKIESLDNPVIPYALQMSEVEVYGTVAPGVTLLLTQEPQDRTIGLGQTATFTVGINAVNGDLNLLTYQWQKNGVNIEGANRASYTTPLLLSGDATNKYRVVVSYPGEPTITSREASIRFNLAQNGAATANGPLWPGTDISMIINGNTLDFVHATATPPTGLTYQIRLPAAVRFDEILIYPRQDGCCGDRFSNVQLSIHNDNNGEVGAEVWSTVLFEDGTNPGATLGTVVRVTAAMDADGQFQGQWLRLKALADPVPDYALQMAEVQAFGSLIEDKARIFVTRQPAPAVGAPGRSATISLAATIFNGDPSLLKIQWQKNGVDIPGATGLAYTTPTLLTTDANARYRAVLSYPGVPDLVSSESTLTFDYNYARGAAASANDVLWGGSAIAQLVDGNRTTVFHARENPPQGLAYEIDMHNEVTLEKIDIYPRQDGCCPERLTNFRVSIHKDDHGQPGEQVWAADLYTDGSNPGSGAGTLVTLTPELHAAGQFKGQWIRILSLDAPPGDYALQMTELEAIGRIAEPLLLTLNRTGTGITLSWSDGILESASELNAASWSAVVGAANPYPVPLNEARRYYRLKK